VVLDTGGPPGQVNNQSPFARTFSAAFTGRSAHAGIEPEKGVNALVLASKLACAIPSGRVDTETTFSFTRMESGTASNVVPERGLLRGEVRSYSESALNDLLSSLTASAKTLASEAGATVEVTSEPMFPPFHIPEETPWVRRLFAAAEAEGFRPFAKRSGGGSDANTLNDLGLPAVNIGVGYRKGHSPEEHLIVKEFLGTYRWILRFLKELDQSA
jgi:tripeptide aminopeptidase